MSEVLILIGLILAWISTCLVNAPLSVIALVGGTGVALMAGGYIWPKVARAVQRKKKNAPTAATVETDAKKNLLTSL